jgi:tetratricopeptide (TPR) repeat protein
MANLRRWKIRCNKEQPGHVEAKLRYFLIVVLLLFMGFSESAATNVRDDICQKVQGKPEISQLQARRILTKYISTIGGEVTNNGFSFIKDGNRKYVNFINLPETLYIITVVEEKKYHWISTQDSDTFSGCLFYFVNDYASAQRCGYIINVMKYYASGASSADETANFMAFKEKAKTWRGLPAKPSLPAEANRYRVLAEDAFKSKDFDKAIDYYDKALEAYPLWPQGQFNAALICGETGDYAEAVGHMKRYLELAPEAKDAKAAQEKIFIWEEKAKQ